MARRLTWSPEAVEDVEAIARYIARDSAQYARAVISRIVSTAASLPENPELGRVVPEFRDPQLRERFVHRYRVIYRLEPAHILVAAVIHGSRELEPFSDRLSDV